MGNLHSDSRVNQCKSFANGLCPIVSYVELPEINSIHTRVLRSVNMCCFLKRHASRICTYNTTPVNDSFGVFTQTTTIVANQRHPVFRPKEASAKLGFGDERRWIINGSIFSVQDVACVVLFVDICASTCYSSTIFVLVEFLKHGTQKQWISMLDLRLHPISIQ